MPRLLTVSALSIASCFMLAALVGCTSRSQQLMDMQGALSSRYLPDGPVMNNDAEPVGTHEPEITLIPADSARSITLVSARLMRLPGFRVPKLLSTGVVVGKCPASVTAFPSASGRSIAVTVNGHSYQPLPLRGYRMQIGAGCVPQIIYVVEAKSAGQYAIGGLSVLVRYDGRLQTMFAYDGLDVWFYDSGPLPSAAQVTSGLQKSFSEQVALYRAGR
jgi:hypothetical protein